MSAHALTHRVAVLARGPWVAVRGWLTPARAHPRHLVLAAGVAGLLVGLGPRPVALVLAALVAAVAGRPVAAIAAVAAVLAGAMVCQARLGAIDRTALGPLLGRGIAARAVVLEAPRRTASGMRSVRVRLLGGPGRGEQVLVRLGRTARRGTLPGADAPEPGPAAPGPASPTLLPTAEVGQIVSLHGRLAPLAPWEAFQRRRGVHAAVVPSSIRLTSRARGGLPGALDRVRVRAERGLSSGLDPPEAALLRGMVLGEDEAIAEPVREDFRRSGLAHLLAVSGQNVLLLATLALAVAAMVGVPLRARLLAVLALIAVYVPLAGGAPSIQRAGAMGAAGVVAALAGRPASRWYALLLAAAVTLAINPHSAEDPGWQLSFAAVVALLAWAGRFTEALRARGLPRGVAEAAAITAAATIGTTPLLAFHFERVSLDSLPANLLAAPAVAPIMWLGMAAAALAQVSLPAAALLDTLALYPLAYLEWIAHAAASVPHAAVPVRLGSVGALAGVYAAVALAVRKRAVRRALAAVVLVGLAVAGALHARSGATPPPGVLRVSFLDVGQGDATLVQHGERALLVDAGPPDGAILARLRRAGVERLDVLVVTHAQADHEGGAPAVLAHHPVGLLLDGAAGAAVSGHRAVMEAARRVAVRRVVPDAGQVLRAGPLELRVLWPHREPAALHAGEDPNRRAVVALVRDGAFDLLLTADAESDVTAALPLPPVDALKVAHHGSADPGLPGVLRRLRPAVAAIEVGRHNPYGHPAPQALAALRSVPHVYRTDRDGTVTLTVEGGRMREATSR